MALKQISNQRIAILEDSPTNRDRLSDLVKSIGGIPIPASPRAPKLDHLELFFKNENISMVICDHRLFEHGSYANYSGAEAVAISYKSGLGGVLVTSWEKEDAESSIREYRRWIPSLIHSTNLKRETLITALIEADKEARQNILGKRRIPYRTIMTIQRIINIGSDKVVKVVMSQWDINKEVGFPFRLIPSSLHKYIEPGRMLIAQVNIEANREEELYFDKFEIPDANVLKKTQTYFNNP
jgi:hypothetical protein